MKIFLIGMMGSGKSSVGKKLSEFCELPFYDTDEMIIRSEGISIKDIFKNEGEKYFRHIESESLKKTDSHGVISCGGGIILNNQNRRYLKDNGSTIFLKSSISTLKTRLLENIDKNRPLIDYGNLKKSLESTYENRKSFYIECANTTIVTDNKSLSEICKKIIENLKIEKI